ncbi:molybdopterin-guanine dinucleotide biosynthesis protein MoaC, partial [Rhodococcus rhodochrous]
MSHLDDRGRARMVDVSGKADTARVAVAAGELVTTAEVVSLVRADDMPKADVLATARIAGIAAAKRTWELIPLCHQLALSSVKVAFGFTDTAITIEATAKTKGPTGVEMEALTAVAVAGLTLHDMVKAVDPAAVLNGVRLVSKEGGKRGHWQRDEAETAAPAEDETVTPDEGEIVEQAGVPATVLVASTGVAAGTREDRTGPLIADFLEARGFTVRGPLVYADADIAWGLEDALAGDPALVISTGGTGASPTDATPEATLALLDRELPGVADAIR